MNDQRNDCTECLARLDGSKAKYCYHTDFQHTHQGDGKELTTYPEAPSWCPGMVREQ